jgi:hypothetical protein
MTNKRIALLEYSFLFEPDTTWQRLSDFEDDLARFFRDNGLEAEIVKTVDGQVGNRVLWIKKHETALANLDTTKIKGVGKSLNDVVGKMKSK